LLAAELFVAEASLFLNRADKGRQTVTEEDEDPDTAEESKT
jgi:hypothetical protein